MFPLSRRSLTVLLPCAGASLLTAQTTQPDGLPPLGAELVKDWIVKAHRRKIEAMKELLQSEPNLLQSSWDWGKGDYESAVQAAAHTGSRDMALFLIDQGARFDLFAATMLGQMGLLKSTVDTYPATLQVRGAHGIPLLSHAIVGGPPAQPALEYLVSKGVDVNAISRNGSTPLMAAVQSGRREVVQMLLSKGADPKIKALSGATALSLSQKNSDANIVSDLKAAGAME